VKVDEVLVCAHCGRTYTVAELRRRQRCECGSTRFDTTRRITREKEQDK
jgi:DNA-directed RNA polymerase subunit RPC12/RpoP